MGHRCWAQELGGCAKGFSGEHVISKGLFTEKLITVTGAPWSQQGSKVISLESLKSNILCAHHNSALSPVDAEAQKLFHALPELGRLAASALALRPTVLTINGPLLERWFVKTTINIQMLAAKGKAWIGGSDATHPPIKLVRWAFGLDPVPPPCGLWDLDNASLFTGWARRWGDERG